MVIWRCSTGAAVLPVPSEELPNSGSTDGSWTDVVGEATGRDVLVTGTVVGMSIVGSKVAVSVAIAAGGGGTNVSVGMGVSVGGGGGGTAVLGRRVGVTGVLVGIIGVLVGVIGVLVGVIGVLVGVKVAVAVSVTQVPTARRLTNGNLLVL